MPNLSRSTLSAALVGYEFTVQQYQTKIAEIRAQLGLSPKGDTRPRRMSAAARRRIGEAQRERWANWRRKHAGRKKAA